MEKGGLKMSIENFHLLELSWKGEEFLNPKGAHTKQGFQICFISQVVFGSGEFFDVRIKQKRCLHVEMSSEAE